MGGQFYARVRARSLNRFDSVAFVQHLQARWPERKLLVIWDGSPIHRFKAVRAFQTTPAAENFVFEQLPGYAPDLNPLDAGVWYHLKDVSLANVCCQNLDQTPRGTGPCHQGFARQTSLHPGLLWRGKTRPEITTFLCNAQ